MSDTAHIIPEKKRKQYTVAILAMDNLALFEFGCAMELFALERPEFNDWYTAKAVTFEQGPLNTLGGLQVNATTISHLESFNMLVIPGWPTGKRAVAPHIADAIRRFIQRGGRVLSFCSGAFLLAEIGALNGRKALTHWRYAETFKSRYPHCEYADEVLYVYDGQIGCSAGSAAGIDLGLAVIREDFGYKAANSVARRLVLPAHRSGGQSQFVETPVLEKPGLFADTLDWAIKNLGNKMDVNLLAQKAGMSRRTFDRKFRSSMDMSAKTWLIEQGLNLAKQLLLESTSDMERLASQCGFNNAMLLRHHFRKSMGLSPSQYRSQFAKTK